MEKLAQHHQNDLIPLTEHSKVCAFYMLSSRPSYQIDRMSDRSAVVMSTNGLNFFIQEKVTGQFLLLSIFFGLLKVSYQTKFFEQHKF